MNTQDTKPNWRAISLVAYGKGMGNKWVCRKCKGNGCVKVVSLNDEPQEDWCKGVPQ